MKNAPKIKDISRNLKEIPSVVDVSYVDAPHTQIQGRAQILDLSKIPAPTMGIERIDFKNSLITLPNEKGPAGELVFGSSVDHLNRVRFIGDYQNTDGADGTSIDHVGIGGFIEITFYGTGLNYLTLADGADKISDVIFNDEAPITTIDSSGSPILSGNNYGPRNIIPIVSNKTVGLHTVRMQLGTPCASFGFEIVNETTTLEIPAGTLLSAGTSFQTAGESVAYGSTFENEFNGTDQGKGGAVCVYMDSQGVVKKDINWTDATQLNLGSADHSNEEVLRSFSFREFGSGTGNGFDAEIVAGSDKAFTLDDGTTTLVGEDIRASNYGVGYEVLFGSGAAGSISFTFVGTGLDIIAHNDGNSRDWPSVDIDGVAQGAYTPPAWTGINTVPIVSGLPYGTHTVRFGTNGGDVGMDKFIVYGPKKPSIPEGVGRLGSYYLIADFVANSTPGLSTISTGVMRKDLSREAHLTGGWDLLDLNVVDYIGGYAVRADSVLAGNEICNFTFFGTGFDLRFFSATNRTDTVKVVIDGVDATSGSTYGAGASYSAPNLNLNGTSTRGDGFYIDDLPLGLHTVSFQNQSTSAQFFILDAIDIITPIHSYRSSSKLLNDRLVGSNGINTEIGLPDFQEGKSYFPDGVDLGASKVKWQRKELQTTYSTTANNPLPDLTLNNLTVGKTYRLTLAGYFIISGTSATELVSMSAKQDGVTLVELIARQDLAGSVSEFSIEKTIVYTAESSVLEISGVIAGTGSILATQSTYTLLEELPNHIETDEW